MSEQERDLSQLRAHVREFHHRMTLRPLPRANADLSRAHAHDHHHFEGPLSNHTHGPKGDAGSRPEGWFTGKDAVRRNPR